MNIRCLPRAWALALAALLSIALAGPARAEQYRYSFLTDPFTVDGFFPRASPDVPTFQTFQERLLVSVYTDGLLTGPAGEADILRFEITLIPGEGAPALGGQLGSPFPPPGSVCCTVYTEFTWNFNIGALGVDGLPTTWDIWINRFQTNPATSENFRMASSNLGNSLSLVAENFYSVVGSSTNAPGAVGGIWTVAAVPEPASVALMLAGLAVMGAAARRRRLFLPRTEGSTRHP